MEAGENLARDKESGKGEEIGYTDLVLYVGECAAMHVKYVFR